MAYTKDEVSDASQRPITFSFNGGPGSASVWLHLGLLGPRRVQMGDAGTLLPPPYKLVDNDVSLLDISDLVFIDPFSPATAALFPARRRINFTVLRQAFNPSPILLSSVPPATNP